MQLSHHISMYCFHYIHHDNSLYGKHRLCLKMDDVSSQVPATFYSSLLTQLIGEFKKQRNEK